MVRNLYALSMLQVPQNFWPNLHQTKIYRDSAYK